MGNLNDPAQAVAWLSSTAAVRERCNQLFGLAERDALPNFQLHLEALPAAADYVAQAIRENYPTLEIPYHARWRHFSAGGIDRWGQLAATLKGVDADEVARIRFDLCVVSVLLDAGAGPDWSYNEDGRRIARSEGLAVASLHAFRSGLFSGDKAHPLRADAAGLMPLAPNAIAHAFQASDANPLVGVEGRAALMRNLGQALKARPDLFGAPGRIGGLYDYLKAHAVKDGKLPATAILAAVLDGLGPIWPSRMTIDGTNLGDVWRHRGLMSGDLTSGLVPFHKLSQWLTYSLVEIFEDAGITVTGLDDLTGLPEYRNGGLFIDLGVLSVRHEALLKFPIPVEDEAVVEWRGLTVALLDRIADPVRQRLGKTAAEMPLARILEGGTWAAGRKIAKGKRPDGGPPLTIASDGTVF
ncbi:URC4/urg3 family protein [Ferrovibrio sp.]|uniref:URC4/urg3 family protein n=1 Tax=Ferrovibrio sp. TaxID=1917215 RepID=UPI00261473AA|nr:URC4/urg3 family protein [Ferrovibrio sp.]